MMPWPPLVLTLVATPSYMILINLIYFRGYRFFSKTHHIASLAPYHINSLCHHLPNNFLSFTQLCIISETSFFPKKMGNQKRKTPQISHWTTFKIKTCKYPFLISPIIYQFSNFSWKKKPNFHNTTYFFRTHTHTHKHGHTRNIIVKEEKTQKKKKRNLPKTVARVLR